MNGNQTNNPTQALYPPPAAFAQSAHIGSREAYDKLVAEAQQDHTAYWARLAKELLSWHKPFTRALDESHARYTNGSTTASSTPRTTAWIAMLRPAWAIEPPSSSRPTTARSARCPTATCLPASANWPMP